MPRLFVGLAPDEHTVEELHAAAARVLDPARWRLYGARDIHLTLCFLGEVERTQAEPLVRALAESCSHLVAPKLEIAGLGAFPDAAQPRVVWAGVRASEAGLEALHAIERAVTGAVERVGLPHAARGEFVPHLTLARPRGRANLDSGSGALGGGWPWRPTEVILFESVGGFEPVGGTEERYRRRSLVRLGGI